MLALLLVAVSLGTDNLAVSIGLGMSGVDNRTRVCVAVVFGLFETAMPLIGLAIGHGAATYLGSATKHAGAALLVGVGVYTIMSEVREPPEPSRAANRGGRLGLTALALSIDNLVIGFAIASLDVPLPTIVAVIGTASVAMSLVGLELGNQLGARTTRGSELIGGTVLVIVGLALFTGLLG